MGKWCVRLVWTALAAVGLFGGVWWLNSPLRSLEDDILRAYRPDADYGPLSIEYPLNETVFPPEIASPTVRWLDGNSSADVWLGVLDFADGGEGLRFLCRQPQWQPADDLWSEIKQRTHERPATLTLLGVREAEQTRILSKASISFQTSRDAVDAPLFFREVNVPFLEAVKDPAAHIRWRFGDISLKEPPPIVLEKLPVCGNCHSFSANGATLAMEVDSGNDKGSYAILPVAERMHLDNDRLITWSDYKREDKQLTFGLLCQASPDGRYVVGTVKDRALAVYKPDLEFSQLFFLVKGILAIYDRETKTFTALPGADDPAYVQTNATWSPDGKTIVFARSRDPAYDPPSLRNLDTVVVPRAEADAFLSDGRTYLYDLYRIPFNDGKGGKAEPLPGASNNGMSNYFPKFSPDGRWIVFCQAKSFMLLQPDSELYILPAEGGEARRLRANTGRMNSWHSWSPNGKWLVFSSKAFSIYTQLFLTHIDEQGESSPPVVLANFTEPQRAANIPEFVNARPGAIKNISFSFLDDRSYVRTGYQKYLQGDFDAAAEDYRRALEYKPDNSEARFYLGVCCMALGRSSDAETCFRMVLELSPENPQAHYNLGLLHARQRRPEAAVSSLREAVRLEPGYFEAHKALSMVLLELGNNEQAKAQLLRTLQLSPDDASTLYYYARTLHTEGDIHTAADLYERALRADPDQLETLMGLALLRATAPASLRSIDAAVRHAQRACELTHNQNPLALDVLARALAEAGQLAEAVHTATAALQIARASGSADLVNRIQQHLQVYQQLVRAK